MIEHAGQRGVLREVLAWTFYPGKSKSDAERLISVHINHLNEFLEETDVRVSASGRRLEPYRVIKRNVNAPINTPVLRRP